MEASSYLQSKFENTLKNNFVTCSSNIIKVVLTSFLSVLHHHGLKATKDQTTLLLSDDEQFKSIQWNQYEGFDNFEKNFLEKIHCVVNGSDLNEVPHLLNFKNNEDDVLSFKMEVPHDASVQSNTEQFVGACSYECFDGTFRISALFRWKDSSGLYHMRAGQQFENTKTGHYICAGSFTKTIFASSADGCCSFYTLGNETFKKVPFECMLDTSSPIQFLNCKRIQGSSVLFWGGLDWSHHTGINESAISEAHKKLNRLFLPIDDIDYETLKNYKVVSTNGFTSVKLHDEIVCHFKSLSTHASKNVVCMERFPFALTCSNKNCTDCGIHWFYKTQCGVIRDLYKVKKIISIAMF